MTNQEAFDTVKQHLLTQRAKSKKEGGGCAYRGLNGLKCAIGCLSPDSEYSPDFEMLGVNILKDGLPNRVSPLKCLSSLDGRILKYLQITHDLYPVEEWEVRLKEASEFYALEWK